MATVNFAPGTKVSIDGKEYTLQAGANLDDGIESRSDGQGGVRYFSAEGEEVNQDGSHAKPSKAASKPKK